MCLVIFFFANSNSSPIFVGMKRITSSQYIHALIAQGEHVEQDFKFEISDARKIARSLSAFANTQGGRLLVGVKDNGNIAGVRSEEEMYMIDAAARLYCIPEVAVTMHTYLVEGRTVLVVEVPQQHHKPVMALDENNKPWAYVRVADENILASPVHLQVWQQAHEAVPVSLSFSDRERALLMLLSQGEECSLSSVCRGVGIRRSDAQQLLARFVHWGVVAMRYDGHRFVFRNNE